MAYTLIIAIPSWDLPEDFETWSDLKKATYLSRWDNGEYPNEAQPGKPPCDLIHVENAGDYYLDDDSEKYFLFASLPEPKEVDYDEEEFIDMAHDQFEDVVICGMKYPALEVLQEIDPIAFRQVYLDWIDGMREEGGFLCGKCESHHIDFQEASFCCV